MKILHNQPLMSCAYYFSNKTERSICAVAFNAFPSKLQGGKMGGTLHHGGNASFFFVSSPLYVCCFFEGGHIRIYLPTMSSDHYVYTCFTYLLECLVVLVFQSFFFTESRLRSFLAHSENISALPSILQTNQHYGCSVLSAECWIQVAVLHIFWIELC